MIHFVNYTEIPDIDSKIIDVKKILLEKCETYNGDLVKTAYNISEEYYNKIKHVSLDTEYNIDILNKKISNLESTVFNKRDIIPNEISPIVLKSESSYKKITDCGLPDYNKLKQEQKTLLFNISEFNKNYGELKFNHDCSCCEKNKNMLGKFNIDTDIKRNGDINTILQKEVTDTKNFNKAVKFMKQIEIYRVNKKQNAEIGINNEKYDRLHKLKMCRDILIYEEIRRKNDIVDKILTRNKAQIDLNRYLTVKEQMGIESRNIKIREEIDILTSKLERKNLAEKYLVDFALSEKYILEQSRLNLINGEIKSWQAWRNFNLSQELDKLEKYKNKISGEIKNLENLEKLKNLKFQKKIFEENFKISEKIKKISAEIKNLEIDRKEKSLDKEKKISELSAIAEKNFQVAELTKNTTTYTSELKFLNIYKKCVDKKKGISQKILENLCQILTAECNIILHEIAEFEIILTLEQNNLRIYTSESNVKIPASMASGYQKFVMDMILRIVLTTTLSRTSNNISNPGMLILDEGFGCLDKKNFVEVACILKKLKSKFKNILVITHIDELKTYADELINIERSACESKIIYGRKLGDESGASEMLKMDLMEEINTKSAELEKVRREINVKQAEKKAVIDAKKAAKSEKANVIKRKKEELDNIMASNDSIKEKIIEEYQNEDNVSLFKCKACNK